MTAGWQTEPLDDLCEFKNGLWKGKKVPFQLVGVIRNTNFGTSGEIDESNIAYLDVESRQFSTRKLQYGDIILEKSGGGPKQAVGRVVLFERRDGDFSFSNFTTSIRIKDQKKLDFHYLHRLLHFYYLSGKTEPMQRHSTGIRNLQLKEYRTLCISYPPLSEQKRIVGVLDEAIAMISKAIANTDRNLVNARELFESQLSRVFAQKGDKWFTSKLSDVVEKTCSLSYGIVQPGKDFPKGLPVVRPTDMKTKVVRMGSLKLIDPSLADAYKRTALLGGELLLCVRGSTGTVSVAPKGLSGANVTRGIVPIRFDGSIINQGFGYYLLKSKLVQDQIRANTYGAALMQINIRDLRNLTVAVPPMDRQKTILRELDDLSKQAESVESACRQKVLSLAQLKLSIMHNALAGELIARNAEESFA